MTIVVDQNTDEMNGKRPFEDRVFARFDALDSAMQETKCQFQNRERFQKLEIWTHDPEPIWEQVFKEIAETRRELSERLDRIEAIVNETRSRMRDVKDRLNKMEPRPTP
jgi:vacuolar-type H+-ATPase subunit I/STV1